MTSQVFKQDGFSLLEVVGGILVFAFGILALCRAEIASINTNLFANELTQATMLAQDRLETLLRLPFDNPANPSDPAWPLNDRNGDGTNKDIDYGLNKTGLVDSDHFAQGPERLEKYSVSWNIAADQPIAGNKTIRLFIQWTDKKGIQHFVTMDCVKGLSY
jgi:hypothetical protein